MTRPFDDTTRRNIAERCAAFARLPAREPAPALKRAAVAITLVAAGEARRGTALLLTRRAAGLRSHRGQWALPGGRCDAGETPVVAALRELHEELGLSLGPGQVLGLLDDYPTRSGYLITPVVVWAADSAAISPNPEEVASVHRIALDDDRTGRRVRLHRHSGKQPPGDPFSSRRANHSRADGGADLSVPRGAGRSRHPSRRAGTAGVCLEVAAGINRRSRFGADLRDTLATTGHAPPCNSSDLGIFRARAAADRAARAVAMDAVPLPAATAGAMAQAASPQAIAEYRRKLKQYQEARAAFEQEAGAYWNAIAEKRRGRNAKRREHQAIALDDYVLTQPPVYAGPKRPVNPEPEPRAGASAARAQIYSRRRRSPEGRRRAVPVHAAAAGQRNRVQARLCPQVPRRPG